MLCQQGTVLAVLVAFTSSVVGLSFTQYDDRYRSTWVLDWTCENDQDCNHFGRCDTYTGQCQCEPAHFGQRCQHKRCPTKGELTCSGHGACVTTQSRSLSLPNPLTAAGEQNFQGTCLCEDGYSGAACEFHKCLDDCAPGGRREGTCEADSSKAVKLHTWHVQTENHCNCFPGSYGENCALKRCPVSPRGLECDSAIPHPEVPNGQPSESESTNQENGHCNQVTGKCECVAGRYGPACELRLCPGEIRTVRFGDFADKNSDRVFHSGHQDPSPTYLDYNTQGTDSITSAHEGFSEACFKQGTCDHTTGKCACFEGFYGDDCLKRQCPNSTRGLICDNAGTCDSSSGECQCSMAGTPWPGVQVAAHGKDCSLRHCPAVNGVECDGEGSCDSATGLCACLPGRYGPDCSLRRCPHSQATTSGPQPVLRKSLDVVVGPHWTNFPESAADIGAECNNKGTCSADTGMCECVYGWHGSDCSLKHCPEHLGLPCNGEGSCDSSAGVCKCNAGFYGASCEQRKCQSSISEATLIECSGHGICSAESGVCQCESGYYGADCGLKRCPNHHGRTCNLNGHCVSAEEVGAVGEANIGDGHALLPGPDGRGRDHGVAQLQHLSGSAQGKCVCNAPFYGDSCQFKTCPVSQGRQLQCDGHGACSKETGLCRCTPGYSGLDCSVGTCPEHHKQVCNNQGKCMQTNNLIDAADHMLIDFDEDGVVGENPFTLMDEALSRGEVYADTADNPSNRGWGYCICTPPFYGRSCEKKRCTLSAIRNTECDGHGACDTQTGICRCDPGYSGHDCSHKACPEYNGRVCNLHGECQMSDTTKVDLSTSSTTAIRSAVGADVNVGVCKCKFPYFGVSCELRACPSETMPEHVWLAETPAVRQAQDCSGHGACSFEAGTCTCDQGWYGTTCNRLACPEHEGKVCNLQGACTRTAVDESSAGSTCKCTPPFFGDACQFKRCPISNVRAGSRPQRAEAWSLYTNHESFQATVWDEECDGHGSCNHKTGRCTCQTGYSGESCERKACPMVNGYECNNVGECVHEDQADDNLGTCRCTWPFFGSDCSKKHCPVSGSNTHGAWHGIHRSQECDGQGTCNYATGRCDCDDGFSGLDCTVKKGLCPMSNKNRQREWRVCNGEGVCNKHTGLCHCYSEEFSGLDCSYRRCPFYPEVNGEECNSHGECIQAFDDLGQWTGVCKCHDGWSGKFCHELYTQAARATSRPPPSYRAAVWDTPLDSKFTTSSRRHIILGSEGYMDTRRAANQGENVGGEMDVDETLHTGSFQTPLTSERSADYYAGQHPINVATCVLNVTGCQHAVTHPEVSTGQSSGMTQPSWQQSLDQDGTELWTDAGVGGSSHSAYVAPHYSGVGGPEYSPAFTRVTNDAGQVS